MNADDGIFPVLLPQEFGDLPQVPGLFSTHRTIVAGCFLVTSLVEDDAVIPQLHVVAPIAKHVGADTVEAM